MTRSSTWPLRTVGAVSALFAPPAPAQDGATAPPGRWYTEGGCASHSGVSESRPLRGDLHAAWRATAKGAIEGEPLVWDEVLLLSEQTRPNERRLRTLRLHDGGERCTPVVLRTDQPL